MIIHIHKYYGAISQNLKRFASKDPTVLRVLSEWAQNLEAIFADSQRYVMMRVYPFKDLNNQPIYLSLKQKSELVHNLKRQHKEIIQKLNSIKRKSNQLVGQILCKESDSFASNIFRYSDTRQVLSKINAVLSAIMVEYLSVLITHLLRAGRIEIPQSKENCHLNLLVFGVTHLLRAKLNCDQPTLSTAIKTLNILDDCQSLQKRFRLVKISDKISAANRVQVNYMFMDLLQCQLELVLEQPKGREKHYLTFGKYIQQLTLHQLGVLPTCAQIISQCDPVTSLCTTTLYTEKTVQDTARAIEDVEIEQNQMVEQSQASSCIIKPHSYECEECGALTFPQNNKIFEQPATATCMKCWLEREDCLSKIKNAKMKKVLLENLKSNKIERVHNYSQLKITNQNFIPVLTVDSNAKLQFKIVVFIRNELSHFFIAVTHNTIKDVIENSINYKLISYTNITPLINHKHDVSDSLIFEVRKVEDLSKEALELMGFNHKEYVQHIFENATQLAHRFDSYRKEKNLIKSIKFKAEIINCDHDKEKWDIFTKLLQIYSKTKVKKDNTLKYQKYKTLEFDRIKLIQANNCHIFKIPEEISLCVNLRQFIAKDSQIRDGLNLKLKKLRHLHLQHNLIEKALPSTELKQLQYLDLTYNQLQSTDSLAPLTSLKQLNLSCNQLQRVDGLSSLHNLTKLLLKQNQLQNIEGVASLTNLTYLQLSSNNLRNVDSLITLANLTHLYLGWNEIRDIKGLSQLVNLKVLDLNLNQLQSLDGLSSLAHIKQLYLSSNQLKNVQDISFLLGLNKLVLSFNQIQNVDFLNRNINLQFLSVNDNQLKHSVSFKKLYKLKEISVQDNPQLKITDLPVSLQKLYADLPAVEDIDFKHMIYLREINIKGPLYTSKFKNLPQGVQIKTIE